MKKVLFLILPVFFMNPCHGMPLNSDMGKQLTTSLTARCDQQFKAKLGYVDSNTSSFCNCIVTKSVELLDISIAENAMITGNMQPLFDEMTRIQSKVYDACM